MAQPPSNWIRFTNGGAAGAAGSAAALLAELRGIALLPLADAARGTFTAHAVQLAREAAAAMVGPARWIHGLSLDERAAIYLYTLEVNPGYRELNRKLRNSLAAARADFNYTKLLQTALAKLPAFDGGIWRSINVDFEEIRASHGVGSRVAWLSFNSCTVDGDTAQQFLGHGTRTLFMVDKGHTGVDIRDYSSLPESEILLPAGIELEVKAVISPSADLAIVHLAQVLDAPPVAESAGLIVETRCATCTTPGRAALGYIELDLGMDFDEVILACEQCGAAPTCDEFTRFKFAPGCKWSVRGRDAQVRSDCFQATRRVI